MNPIKLWKSLYPTEQLSGMAFCNAITVHIICISPPPAHPAMLEKTSTRGGHLAYMCPPRTWLPFCLPFELLKVWWQDATLLIILCLTCIHTIIEYMIIHPSLQSFWFHSKYFFTAAASAAPYWELLYTPGFAQPVKIFWVQKTINNWVPN